MICSPILLVGRSRSEDSCTYFSTAFTMLSSFDDGTGRFSQARNSPAMTLLRSKASRRPSFLITMYGISSIRSYVVKRRSHFKHSRRRRIVSPVRPSRESITLSSVCPQNGHFMRLLRGHLSPCRAPPLPPTLLFRAPPSRAIARTKTLHESTVESPQSCTTQTSPARAPTPPPRQPLFLLQIPGCTQRWPMPALPRPPSAIARSIPPA